MKDDSVYLKQILDAVSKIESFVSRMSREKFKKDKKTQSAVIMQLILIGETAKKISSKTKQKIDLPWREIAGFRNEAVHNYFDVDLDIVWRTLEEDLPMLKEKLRSSLL